MDKFSSPLSQETTKLTFPLTTLPDRRISCGKCNKKIKYYCYYCCEVVDELIGKIPNVALPFSIDICRDSRELEGKSTSVHAKLLSPVHVNIITYHHHHHHPKEEEKEELIPLAGEYVLYPSDGALDISQEKLPVPLTKLIVLDGTWSQSKGMVRRFARFPKVTFSPERSFFWRYQNFGPHCLSTIEAIYHFVCQYAVHQMQIENVGQFDGLLFFFVHFYHLIQTRYASCTDESLKYHSKHRADYIQRSRSSIETEEEKGLMEKN